MTPTTTVLILGVVMVLAAIAGLVLVVALVRDGHRGARRRVGGAHRGR